MEKIEEIKEAAKEADKSTGGFMEPGTKVKGKPGRKPGQKNKKPESEPSQSKPEPQQVQGPPTSELLKPGLSLISEGAARWCKHKDAQMTPQELDMGAQLLGQLMDKYAPNALTKYGLEITCAVVFAGYGIRVLKIKRAMVEFEKNKPPPSPPQSAQNMPDANEPRQFRGPEIVN